MQGNVVGALFLGSHVLRSLLSTDHSAQLAADLQQFRVEVQRSQSFLRVTNDALESCLTSGAWTTTLLKLSVFIDIVLIFWLLYKRGSQPRLEHFIEDSSDTEVEKETTSALIPAAPSLPKLGGPKRPSDFRSR